SLFVEADHPVPQRLAVHTTSFRRLFPRCSVEDRSDRQKPTCLRRVLRPFGQTANFGARIVCFHCNRSTHDEPSSGCQVESFRERFGNRESLNQRIGISQASRSSSINTTQSRNSRFCQWGLIDGKSQWELSLRSFATPSSRSRSSAS